MGFGPFLSQEEIDKINQSSRQREALRRQGIDTSPHPLMIPGKMYGIDVEDTSVQPRSRYSAGAPGGAGQFEPSDPSERTGRTARRGGGVRDRDVDLSFLKGGKVRGRSGAARNVTKTPPTPQALDSGMTNNTSVKPITADGASSPSFYEAVKRGPDGDVTPGSIPPTVVSTPTPKRDNMASSSELERYKAFVNASARNKEIAKRVKPGQAGYEEIQAILNAEEGGMSAEDILAGMEDSFGKTAAEVKAFNSGEGNEVLIGYDDPVPTGRNTSAPVPGDIPQKGTAMGSSNVNLTPGPQPGSRPFTSVALAGTEGSSQQRDLTTGVPFVEPIADALDQSRAVTVDQSPTGKEFFNKYFNRTFGR